MHRLVERQLHRAQKCRSLPALSAKEPQKCNKRGELFERTAALLAGSLRCIRESEIILARMKVAEAPDNFQRILSGCEEVIRLVDREKRGNAPRVDLGREQSAQRNAGAVS